MAWRSVSLSQLMHKREAGLGPLEDIPHMRDEPALQFDWEESIEIQRGRAGLWTSWPGRRDEPRRSMRLRASKSGTGLCGRHGSGPGERDEPEWLRRLRAVSRADFKFWPCYGRWDAGRDPNGVLTSSCGP